MAGIFMVGARVYIAVVNGEKWTMRNNIGAGLASEGVMAKESEGARGGYTSGCEWKWGRRTGGNRCPDVNLRLVWCVQLVSIDFVLGSRQGGQKSACPIGTDPVAFILLRFTRSNASLILTGCLFVRGRFGQRRLYVDWRFSS